MKKKKHRPLRHEVSAFTRVHVRDEGVISEEAEYAYGSAARKEIDEGLQAIYAGDANDLRKAPQAPGRFSHILRRIILILLVLLFGVISVWAGIVWWNNRSSSDEMLTLALHTPQESISGSEVTLELVYANPRSIPLADLSLDLNVPEGFLPATFSVPPTDMERLVWNLGSLGRNSDEKIFVTGTWFADVPSSERVQLIATYRPGNTPAIFSSLTTQTTSFAQSVVQTLFEGPKEAVAGAEVTYRVRVTNTSTTPIELEGELMLPDGLIPQMWEPALHPGEGTLWRIPVLNPGESATQTLTGAFASASDGIQEVHLRLWNRTSAEHAYIQHDASWFTDVEGSALAVSLAGNGATEQVSLAPGEVLRLSTQLTNISDISHDDIALRLDFQPEQGVPIVWSGATLGNGRIAADGIHLSAHDVGLLAPNERKLFSFLFPIKELLYTSDVTNFTVTAYVTSGGVTVQSVPLQVSLNANVRLVSSARYYDVSGVPVGQGPFPPRIDQETTMVVAWELGRELHPLRDISVRATLPPDVTFRAVRDTSLGTLAYDDASRVLTWTITNMPEDMTHAEVTFELGYTPGEEDRDTFGKILSEALLRAVDEITDEVITTETGEITTELVGDMTANGNGIVRE